MVYMSGYPWWPYYSRVHARVYIPGYTSGYTPVPHQRVYPQRVTTMRSDDTLGSRREYPLGEKGRESSSLLRCERGCASLRRVVPSLRH